MNVGPKTLYTRRKRSGNNGWKLESAHHTEIKRNFEILGNQIVDWRLADLRNKKFVWM